MVLELFLMAQQTKQCHTSSSGLNGDIPPPSNNTHAHGSPPLKNDASAKQRASHYHSRPKQRRVAWLSCISSHWSQHLLLPTTVPPILSHWHLQPIVCLLIHGNEARGGVGHCREEESSGLYMLMNNPPSVLLSLQRGGWNRKRMHCRSCLKPIFCACKWFICFHGVNCRVCVLGGVLRRGGGMKCKWWQNASWPNTSVFVWFWDLERQRC